MLLSRGEVPPSGNPRLGEETWGTPQAHRGLPVRVGEDPVDLHLAPVGRCHVDPQPSQTGVPRPVDPRHVVAVVVLLQPGRDGVTGDGVTQLAPWRSKPPGMAQSSRDTISAIKPAQQNPMRSQQRMLSSWRRCREDPRDRLSAERTGWLARERHDSRETSAKQMQPSWEENILFRSQGLEVTAKVTTRSKANN